MVRESKAIRIYSLSISRREYFTFIICITISLSLLFSNNNPQTDEVRAVIVDTWARLLKEFSLVRSRDGMHDEVVQLRRRTSELLLENSRLRKAAIENNRLREMLEFKQDFSYSLLTANVIARNQDRIVRSITIDVGKNHGVKKNMPVLTTGGIVGKIIRAGDESAIVQLVIDHNFRAACKIQRTRVNGILAYEDGEYCLLKQVPKNADVKLGDVVVTSGYSSIFPPEIVVGLVAEVDENPSSLFKDITVKPLAEVGKLEQVFVITQKLEHSHPLKIN